jgi:prepilin-type processing-associated H-X9-DG protein
VTSGTWQKLNKYTQPSQRALVADAQFWLIEANPAPMDGVIPGQKFYNNVATYSAGVSGQTLFDFYRHGSYPKIAVGGDNGYYENKGGKVLYNILFVDGHVEQVTSRETAYRSLRMRFPG